VRAGVPLALSDAGSIVDLAGSTSFFGGATAVYGLAVLTPIEPSLRARSAAERMTCCFSTRSGVGIASGNNAPELITRDPNKRIGTRGAVGGLQEPARAILS
jgi:hypothetical protein